MDMGGSPADLLLAEAGGAVAARVREGGAVQRVLVVAGLPSDSQNQLQWLSSRTRLGSADFQIIVDPKFIRAAPAWRRICTRKRRAAPIMAPTRHATHLGVLARDAIRAHFAEIKRQPTTLLSRLAHPSDGAAPGEEHNSGRGEYSSECAGWGDVAFSGEHRVAQQRSKRRTETAARDHGGHALPSISTHHMHSHNAPGWSMPQRWCRVGA